MPTATSDLLDDLAAADPFDLDAKALAARIIELERLRARLDHEQHRLIQRFDASLAAPLLGYRTTRAFLEHRTHMSGPHASRRVRVARGLRTLPVVAREFAEGRFSFDQALEFTYAVTPRTEEAMQVDEQALVAIAARSTVRELGRELADWKEAVDQDGPEPDAGYRSRNFSFNQTFNGDFSGNLQLGSADGAELYAAVEAMADRLYRQEAKDAQLDVSLARTPGQRRADALLELVRRGLHGDTSTSLAAKASLSLLITLEDAQSGRSATTTHGHRVTPKGLDRLMCDCTVAPIGWSVDGVPLSHGRTRRLPTPAQRRAAIAQYGGCIFPGCDSPAERADIHHFAHVVRDRGPTDQDNLGPACNFHHHLFHEGGWNVTVGPDGGLRFWTPGGIRFDPHPGWENSPD